MGKLNPLLLYKCYGCNELPKDEQINRCQVKSDHILCILCTIKNGLRCPVSINYSRSIMTAWLTSFLLLIQCGGKIDSAVNPLINIVAEKCCPFKSNGCDWVFSEAGNTATHTSECKYRSYKCIGTTMNLWKLVDPWPCKCLSNFIYPISYFRCNWNGLQKDFADHMEQTHLSDRQLFKHWHFGSVPYVAAKNNVIIHLSDAFNKKFLFFYVSFAASSFVHFVVQLLGRKCDAEKYMIELEVGGDLKKIKFVETCHSDAEDLLILLNSKPTMTIPKDYFKQYANSHGLVRFQFVLKRKTAVIGENRQKEEYFKATMLAGEPDRSAQSVTKKISKPTSAPPMQKQQTAAAIGVKAKNLGKQFKNKNNWL